MRRRLAIGLQLAARAALMLASFFHAVGFTYLRWAMQIDPPRVELPPDLERQP